MALERRVLVLPIEDVGRKLLGCAVAHGILEHIMIANGRFLFVTLVHETRVPVGRMRLPETVFTDWHQRMRPRNFNTFLHAVDAGRKASHLARVLQLAHA